MNYSIKDYFLLAIITHLSISSLYFMALFVSFDYFQTTFHTLLLRFIWITSAILLATLFAWYFETNLKKYVSQWFFVAFFSSFFFTVTFWIYIFLIKLSEPKPQISFGFTRRNPTFFESTIESLGAGLGLTILTSIITKSIFRQKEKIVSDDLQLVH